MIETLGRSKSVQILLALRDGKLKFNEIVEIAGNDTTAMRRTRELQSVGLIGRKVLQDRQRSVEYSLTKRGETALALIEELLKLDKRG
ncbi:MAG: winged helix-turn-helix transcriptional regulator [Candidatus Hadarchaeales archaeon]